MAVHFSLLYLCLSTMIVHPPPYKHGQPYQRVSCVIVSQLPALLIGSEASISAIPDKRCVSSWLLAHLQVQYISCIGL